MTQDLASAAAAPGAASAGWSPVAASATPPAFRKDAEDGFPVAGAALLVVLMVAAVWAWWYGRSRGLGARGGRARLLPTLLGRAAGEGADLRIVDAVQGTGGMRLMVVEWAGGRRVLVGASGTGAPVALDVLPAPAQEGQP